MFPSPFPPSICAAPLITLQEDGVTTAIQTLYRDLEYARSLIKRREHISSSGSGEDPGIQVMRMTRSL